MGLASLPVVLASTYWLGSVFHKKGCVIGVSVLGVKFKIPKGCAFSAELETASTLFLETKNYHTGQTADLAAKLAREREEYVKEEAAVWRKHHTNPELAKTKRVNTFSNIVEMIH